MLPADQPGEMLHDSQDNNSKRIKLAEEHEVFGSQTQADAGQGSSEHPASFVKKECAGTRLDEGVDHIEGDYSAKRDLDPVYQVGSSYTLLPSEIKREVSDGDDCGDKSEDMVTAVSIGFGRAVVSSTSDCTSYQDVGDDSSEHLVRLVRRGTCHVASSSGSEHISHHDTSRGIPDCRLSSVSAKKAVGVRDTPAERVMSGMQSETDDNEDLLQLPVHFQSEAEGHEGLLLPVRLQFGLPRTKAAHPKVPSAQGSAIKNVEAGEDSAKFGQTQWTKVKTENGMEEDGAEFRQIMHLPGREAESDVSAVGTEFGFRQVPQSEVKIEIDVAEDMLDQLLTKGDKRGLFHV